MISIDKAIEILGDQQNFRGVHILSLIAEAEKLGIEALKRLKNCRHDCLHYPGSPEYLQVYERLPGETEEEDIVLATLLERFGKTK